MTKVKFYKDKDGEIFAYFPEIRYNDTPGLFTCYADLGQHSACHEDYIKECEDAAYFEYWELLRELIRQGYKDLQVLNKGYIQYHRSPTPSEIKQGYGATHWMEFLAADCVDKAGNVKKWVKGPDGLRYS